MWNLEVNTALTGHRSIGIICFNIPVQNSFKGGSGATASAFGGATDDASDLELWWYFTTEKQIKFLSMYVRTQALCCTSH